MHVTAVSIVQRLHQHRAWANANLLAAAESLSDDQLHREFAIGQGTVWRSLVHMYAAEYIWLETQLGVEDACCPGDVRGKLPGNQLGEGGPKSLPELREIWTAQERRWHEFLQALFVESLDEQVHRVSTVVSGGQRYSIRRSDSLLHVCLHAHHTTAQVLNMLRQLGVGKLPKTMMISLVWQERSST